MFIKHVLVAVMASALGLSVLGCMSSESAEPTSTENVNETAQALTAGVTFDPTALYLNYAVGGVSAGLNARYYPGNGQVVFEVPCSADLVGIGNTIAYNDVGPKLWPAVTAAVGSLTPVTSQLPGMLQGTTQSYGQWSNRPANPLSGLTGDQTIRVVLTLKTYTDAAYSVHSSAPDTSMTYYIRRMCSCP
jgi:hypothetical protein